MPPVNYTPIPNGAPANALTFNNRLQQLDNVLQEVHSKVDNFGYDITSHEFDAVADWNGATGTDNIAAINNALEQQRLRGGIVYVPPAETPGLEYGFTGPLLAHHGVSVLGGGVCGRSIDRGAILTNIGAGDALQFTATYGQARMSFIQNIALRGNASSQDGLVTGASLSHLTVQRVYLRDHGRYGINIGNYNFLHTFDTVWVDYSGGDGIHATPANNNNGMNYRNVWSAYSGGDGWHLTNQAGLNMDGVYADANTGDGGDFTSCNGVIKAWTAESNIGDSMRFYDCPLHVIQPRVTGAGSGTGYAYRIVGGNSSMLFEMPQSIATRAANSMVIGDIGAYRVYVINPNFDKAADYNGKAVVLTGDSWIPPQVALATNATAGFNWVRSSAGAPIGTPSPLYTGLVPMEVDTSTGRVYFYYGGAWHYANLT